MFSCIKRQDQIYNAYQKPTLNIKTQRIKCKKMGKKKLIVKKKKRVAMLISDKVDFRAEDVGRDQESDLVMVKGSVY